MAVSLDEKTARPGGEEAPRKATPLTPYQKKLFFFLSVATFFEGYDFMAITQILPELRASMGLSESYGTLLITVINAGTVLAYLLIRQADRFGRRSILSTTIVGYTICSFLSGLSPNAMVFGVLQLFARVFLIGEWAISMVYAAEEFPAERRGMVIGVIQAFSSFGSIVCAGVVPALVKLPFGWEGWRNVYFVGTLPLILIAFLRRGLKESTRFAERVTAGTEQKQPFTYILSTPYRKRMLQLALIWALTYICTHNAVTFWKEFAIAERGFTAAQAGLSISIAAVASMPLVFLAGRIIDWLGRRQGAVLIFLATALGVLFSYSLPSQWTLTLALIFGIFGASAVLPVLNAYNTELFPTELRSDAFAWSNNLLGRIGYVLSPLAIGFAADDNFLDLGVGLGLGWGWSIAPTAIFPILALILILLLLPETQGKELEETSAV